MIGKILQFLAVMRIASECMHICESGMILLLKFSISHLPLLLYDSYDIKIGKFIAKVGRMEKSGKQLIKIGKSTFRSLFDLNKVVVDLVDTQGSYKYYVRIFYIFCTPPPLHYVRFLFFVVFFFLFFGSYEIFLN